MQFVRKAIKLGNSSGVLLPKNLLGSEVKITVVKRQVDIKKEALKVLHNHLEDLQGIYILSLEPGEILAVSNTTKAIIKKERLKISIVPLTMIKRDIKTRQDLKEKIMKAETILNKNLLLELQKSKISDSAQKPVVFDIKKRN